MKRRDLLKGTAAMGLGAVAASNLFASSPSGGAKSSVLKAGFGRAKINPAIGTKMMGWAGRDQQGCTGIHDDVYVRALYLEHGGEKMLLMGADLCLVAREYADRFKAALGRALNIYPRQILLNVSHNHVAPTSGTWYDGYYEAPDWDYLGVIERGIVRAAEEAHRSARRATLWTGKGRTKIPVCRRRPRADGTVEFAEYRDGITYNEVPLCLVKDESGDPLCLLFSISTHASFTLGNLISAGWPGAAIKHLDAQFGRPVTLFLQGVGGDSKAYQDGWQGGFEKMDLLGRVVAKEVRAGISKGLRQVQPTLASRLTATSWPLQKVNKATFLQTVAKTQATKDKDLHAHTRYRWAMLQLQRIKRGSLPTAASILAHGIKLGDGLRIFALEGEAVAEWGYLIEKFYGKENGLTFPMGYSNGQGLYLPVSRQIPERGYEVDSYWEYAFPAPLAPGMEKIVLSTLSEMRKHGIN